jgi:preprotein translocase subunit SecF
MHLFPKTHFDFIKMRWPFFIFSALLIGGSVVSIATKGVKYGIDFTGGTLVQLTFEKPLETKDLRKAFEKAGVVEPGIQHFTGTNTYSVRIQSDVKRSAEQLEKELVEVQASLSDNNMHVDTKEYVGPAVGKHLFQQALWAIVLSLAGIIVYLGFRFANPVWGLAGIVALLHDVFATYGLFSILGKEVDLLIVSAILTIGGYSIHDTIVIFDRMREKGRIMHKESLYRVMNESINETMSRTVITSMTVFVVVLILYLFGGSVIHHFALAMVFGCLIGTYSSVAVAVPLVYEWSVHMGGAKTAPPQAPASGVKKPKPIKK